MPSNRSIEEFNYKSRDYCFVIMSYKPESIYDQVYEQLCRLIEEHTKLLCIRADRDKKPGRDLLGKVHEMILNSSIVVADVTEYSPNVYYEYGYASAHNRMPILIARKGKRLPTDLVGKEALRYNKIPDKDEKFVKDLYDCLDKEMRSPIREQKRMLGALNPFPAYILASPRVPEEGSKHWWHPEELQTFGDNLGISGILSAYGNIYGSRNKPELLNAQFLSKKILKTSGNFYCIGSSKLNKATKYFLPFVQKNKTPQWQMLLIGNDQDKRVVFQCDSELDKLLMNPITTNSDGSYSDYGLIIRAPHPNDPKHLVLIAAGRHSLGTHAACMTITEQKLIASLEKELDGIGVKLGDLDSSFWAVVKGTLLKSENLKSTIEIVKVGAYQSKN